MLLKLPPYREIRLGNPPLAEVICQVRFPPILRIAKTEPSEFQDIIRSHFPALSIEQGIILSVPQPGTYSPTPEIQPRVYKFATDDEGSFVSLSVDFYALSTRAYKHWNDFARDLALVHDAVSQVYQPSYATRVGLRYINRLTPANTGCSSIDEVLAMLRPQLTAQLRTDAWSAPDEAATQIVLADGNGKLALRTAYGHDASDHAPFFVLDFDYFEEGKIGLADLVERCQRYHSGTYSAFRWCFLDETLSAFHPLG